GLIYKYIRLYNINKNDYDDIYQEAIILMHKTISRFNEKFGKTFTRFYELVLRRRIQYLKSLEPKYDLVEEIFGHGYYDNNNDEEEVLLEQLTDFEREVYQNHFVLNKKIAVIAENNNLESKQIYNAIFRIKEKYKNML
ncbi:MAG TPA: sigma-70 family RNA polymerase sigma factor, partial [Acholeplasmataceae bacterium]|nr:sigma-70 family RNA polymerase sigma factor [Acholeplasmataceae bacterium]